jgi:DNA-binding transcriptional MocR family regulator
MLFMFRYQEIVAEFEHLIKSNQMTQGQKLPSIRTVSQQYNISLQTVIQAYKALENKRLIISKGRSGYYIPIVERVCPSFKTHPLPLPVEVLQDEKHSILFNLYLYSGYSSSKYERSYLTLNMHHQIAKRIDKLLHYANTAEWKSENALGLHELRYQISALMKKQNLTVSPESIVITGGYHNALFMSLRALCSAGDRVAVESPVSWRTLQMLSLLKLNVLEISTDSVEGLCPHALAHSLAQWPIKALLVTPNCNNPLGFIMPDSKKKELLALAEKFFFTIIEDGSYNELTNISQRPTTIKQFDHSGRVILCGSFSRSISTDLKIGWFVPGKWMPKIVEMKYLSVGLVSSLLQGAAASLIESGQYERHNNKIIKIIKRSFAQYIITIERYFPANTVITTPAGGGYLWVVLPEKINISEIIFRAIGINNNILPGIMFSASGRYHNCFRVDCTFPLTNKMLESLILIGSEACALASSPP